MGVGVKVLENRENYGWLWTNMLSKTNNFLVATLLPRELKISFREKGH